MNESFKNLKDIIHAEEIPFMHYGIINKFNYTNVFEVPIKRWDPLSYNPIILNENGKNITLSKNYGHYSYISPIRSSRPFERKNENETKKTDDDDSLLSELIDIFEPMVSGRHYRLNFDQSILPAHTIIISDGNKRIDNPFSDTIKVYPNLESNACSMINKFPAMARVIDSEILPKIQRELNELDKNAKIAFGVCLLTVPRNYHETIEEMTIEELTDFFISCQTAVNFTIEEAIKKHNIEIIPISPFFNVGREVGGSLRRLHMQIYMDMTQDGHGSRVETILKAFEFMKQKQECQLCESKHGDGRRNIIETNEWIAFASGSPIRNYHIRFAPKEHIESISQIKRNQFIDLSKILTIISMVLNDLGVNPSRNILFNSKPVGYNSFFHLFGDILPFEFVGGAEMVDDMRVVRMSPKKFAEDCRSIIEEKKYIDLL